MRAFHFISTVALIALFSFSALADQTKSRSAKFLKRDGRVSEFRLLPVKINPSHVEAVKQRFIEGRTKGQTGLPKTHEISNALLTPVKNQGARGSCAYFATIGVVESYYVKKQASKRGIDLSEQCLLGLRNWMFSTDEYDSQDKPDASPDPNGDQPPLVALTIKKYGVPREKKFEDVDCRYNPESDPQNPDVISLRNYKSTFNIDQTNGSSLAYGKDLPFFLDKQPTIERTMALIARDIPVEVAVFVYEEFRKTSDWRKAGTTKIIGGHAIVLTGYTVNDQGRTIFKFRNSWGNDWGRGGYGTIDDKTIVSGWSQAPEFDIVLGIK